ncbi:unnamed protein product [Heligmosomoides polygyrus]|uniref:TPR_REGION domain-containing protein n=1 Tax=Heligmosomoides polygyrus TaxID=6339 RepID=A0A183GHX1_HELPZ|nr:unnamed protein product [Heligmosomoides polygyrus]
MLKINIPNLIQNEWHRSVSTVECRRRHDSEEQNSSEEGDSKSPLIPLPSKYAIEQIGAKFLDALIKRGQMEMAKGAFKTQLEVLEKVHPDQYEKYKKLKVEDLAADAVMQQAEMAKLQPKTGNPLVDMLNENGIPIASSLKGIEQAIKTQKEMETQDPSEQIAKAVLEKFQTQILPGLVANMIAGRNPFKIPQQMRSPQVEPTEIRRMALVRRFYPLYYSSQAQWGDLLVQQSQQAPVDDFSSNSNPAPPEYTDGSLRRSLANRLRSSPRLRKLLQVRQDSVQHRSSNNSRHSIFENLERPKLDTKSSIVLGLHEMFGEDDDDEDEHLRRSPLSLSPAFAESLKSNAEVREALERIKYRVEDVEQYLKPKPLIRNPNPQPGFTSLVPTVTYRNRPKFRKWMIFETADVASAALKLKIFREILTPEQKGRQRVKQFKAYPRLFGTKTHNPMDGKVSQIIEERPIPPLAWTPKGRHTRLRWVGATEKEIPGIGGRFILPSLDPTMPAVNTAYSTQGRARDEWDTMFKIPNAWQAGDDVGFSLNTKSKRFIGGNGGFDMPAAHL